MFDEHKNTIVELDESQILSAQELLNSEKILPQIQEHAQQSFEKRLSHEVDALLKGNVK